MTFSDFAAVSLWIIAELVICAPFLLILQFIAFACVACTTDVFLCVESVVRSTFSISYIVRGLLTIL